MASLKVQNSIATKPKNSIGETYARKVLSNWNGTHVADAIIAATQIGLIHSGGALNDERARQILQEEFDSRKTDEVNWSVVIEAYRNGRSSVISAAQLRERYYPAAGNDIKPMPLSGRAAFINMVKERAKPANDNTKDDTINAETLLGMDFAPLEYVIPGYVVEGLTLLGGKPKLGKSWWAYDASIAVATGGKAMGSVDCEQGDVLYLALEDNRRRVKDRLF
jgi:hypothetical protein